MGPKLSVTTTVAVAVLILVTLSQPAPVTAKFTRIFAFGDETMDVGNANYFKQATLRADKAPYGAEFKVGSGRFSNGKLTIDYLADLLNISSPRADLAPRNASARFSGISFAFAGAGAKSSTNPGKSRALQQQYIMFKKWFDEAKRTNNPDLNLNETLFVISIGQNDYIAELSRAQPNMTVLVSIASSVTSTIANITQAIFNLTGSANVVVFEVPPLGCIPEVRRAHSISVGCTEAGSNITTVHNFGLLIKTEKIRNNAEAPMTHLVLYKMFQVYKSMIQIPTSAFTNQTGVCCEALTSTGVHVPCSQSAGTGKNMVTAGACATPAKFVYWDTKNPTAAVNQKLATTLFASTNPGIVRPNGLKKLFAL